MDRVLGQWGSSLGRSVKVMGASYYFKISKTGSRAPRKLTPGGALLSTYLSLRWSPSVAGGAAITVALPDVMPTQWRVEWTALAGCGWRSPSLGGLFHAWEALRLPPLAVPAFRQTASATAVPAEGRELCLETFRRPQNDTHGTYAAHGIWGAPQMVLGPALSFRA